MNIKRSNSWIAEAISKIETDYQRSADTHLILLQLDNYPHIDFYFKDESTHPTGSLKHRLARSLFLYALCNGWINENTTVVEASSGSTAISEAYFAKLLGLPFVAVMPRTTSTDKVQAIQFYGGKCHFVEKPSDVYEVSNQIATERNGHFMDQFTYAERATDWRGNNNIAEAIFNQMALERYPIPTWIVVGAGTGGTSATIGRYVRYEKYESKLCVVDPENSVFYEFWKSGDTSRAGMAGSQVEGIGRQRVEPSFIPTIVDEMLSIPDCTGFASMKVLSQLLNRKVGGSTGTNFCGVLQLAERMKMQQESGSIVTLICDSGERYLNTYYDDEWLKNNNLLEDVTFQVAKLKQKLNL